jgi:hypothetical protein
MMSGFPPNPSFTSFPQGFLALSNRETFCLFLSSCSPACVQRVCHKGFRRTGNQDFPLGIIRTDCRKSLITYWKKRRCEAGPMPGSTGKGTGNDRRTDPCSHPEVTRIVTPLTWDRIGQGKGERAKDKGQRRKAKGMDHVLHGIQESYFIGRLDESILQIVDRPLTLCPWPFCLGWMTGQGSGRAKADRNSL